MLTMKTVAIVLFVATYALLLIFPKYRAHVAVASATLFVLLGILPGAKVISAIDWNVLLMILGTMGTVSLFIESRMPALLGDLILSRVPNVKWAIILLSLFAGIISAFMDNVATVLIVVPVAITISRKLDISPVPSVIAISIASNLQGAATLVGDTTSILLGSQANMDFFDFFFFEGKIGLFWIVQVSAILSTVVLYFFFRKYDQRVDMNERTEVTDFFPSLLLLGTILLLIVASFIPQDQKPAITNGIICVGLFLVGLCRAFFRTGNKAVVRMALLEIDFFTLALLAGLFVVVGGITEVGVVSDLSQLFVRISGDNLFVIYSILVWFSVAISAVVDNIPYVATMLPVVAGISALLGVEPYLLYFGLLSGATLGGNITPIGASANITALGMLRKEGYEVKAGEFMKISVPYTLTAVVTGYVLVWLIWA